MPHTELPSRASIASRLDALPFTRPHLRVLTGSGLGWALDAMDVGLISFIIAVLAQQWQLSPTETGWIASIGFVGMARNEESHVPEAYLASLPKDLDQKQIFVLDPMLATGGSLIATCEELVSRGARHITAVCVLCAPEGIAALQNSGLPVSLVTASLDERLNEDAFIVPGLGDAGDRLFGPR